MKHGIMAVRACIAAAIGLAGTAASAQWVVIDPTNLTQTTVSAAENVAQTLKQIQQYQTQLQQYQNMIQNTVAPAAYVWDQAQSTINSLLHATDTLSYYKSQLGSLDRYISKFQDVAYYRGSPCFTSTGCSDSERAAMAQNRDLASQSQKKANDALFRGLDQQQTNLRSDAAQLRLLQVGAQGADGQMKAIGFANQLSSQQANQLLQIRSLLIAQQNALATQLQGQADRDAQTQAADDQSRRGTYRSSSGRSW